MEFYTVEEASRFLQCPQPVDLSILRKLGKDCSMVCRIWNANWIERPVIGKDWPSERAYPLSVILEVFKTNPSVRDFIPK